MSNEKDFTQIERIYTEIKKKPVNLDPNDITKVIDFAHDTLSREKSLVKINAPVSIIGDIHGQFSDLIKLLGEDFDPKNKKYLFLGDYVDRGPNSIEVITFLLCCKILYKDNIFLLRGNHETLEISTIYGFKDEISDRLSSRPDIYERFVYKIFQFLPLAAEVSERIFCVHGGLSQHLHLKNENGDSIKIDTIFRGIRFPIQDANDNELIQDLLWADPSPDSPGYTPSERGTSYTFGKDAVDSFFADTEYELICRAHQVVDNGFDFPFFPQRSVITIFSAPNYCNEFNNKAVMMDVDATLSCKFKFIDPNDPDYRK